MAWALLIGGVVMWVVDALSVRRDLKTKDVEQMTLFQAVWIGLWEVTSAVFPGGLTIHVDHCRRSSRGHDPHGGP